MCALFAGVLACLDGYMNIALEQTEEYVNGQLKNKYGDAFIRGNNGEWSKKNKQPSHNGKYFETLKVTSLSVSQLDIHIS